MVYHDILCDGCRSNSLSFPMMAVETSGPERTKLHQIRLLLKMGGWKVNLPGGKDYCPECWEKMKTRGRDLFPSGRDCPVTRYGARCGLKKGHGGDCRFFCCGDNCQGYSMPASRWAHPASCTGEAK